MHAAVSDVLWLGMKVGDWVNILALLLGPVLAVLITLWIDGRRRNREQQIVVLRLLLATRHTPADPNFGTAINLIPVEFAKSTAVQSAYKDFVQAANVTSTADTAQAVGLNIATKTTRLVYEVARSLGFGLRETDIQSEAYSASGWTKRDALIQDSQQAMRDVANILLLQSRIMANVPLTDEEKRLLGMAGPSK